MTNLYSLGVLVVLASISFTADAEKRRYFESERVQPSPYIPEPTRLESVAKNTQRLVASKPMQIDQDSISIPVNYDVSDRRIEVAGLGVRVHYSSQAMGDFSLSNVSNKSLMGVQDQADLQDFDNDPQTDRFVMVAWAAIGNGGWTARSGEPLFNIQARGLQGNSYINFSEISTQEGFKFAAESIALKMHDAGRVDQQTPQGPGRGNVREDDCQNFGRPRQNGCERRDTR